MTSIQFFMRWDHLTWPSDLTLRDLSLKFSHVRKRCMIRCARNHTRQEAHKHLAPVAPRTPGPGPFITGTCAVWVQRSTDWATGPAKGSTDEKFKWRHAFSLSLTVAENFGTWPDLDLYLHKLALKRFVITFWTILTDFMRLAIQHKVSELFISQTLILILWPDPDLAHDIKIQIESDHWKRLITSFCLPPRPCRCGYWFSSYWLEAFKPPPPASGGWRITPSTAGLRKSWHQSLSWICYANVLITSPQYSPSWSLQCSQHKPDTITCNHITKLKSLDLATKYEHVTEHCELW